MASKNLAKGLKRSALTVALGLCFVGGVQAQTNTAGAVTGQAASGDTITVANPATGFSRTITVGGDGTYRFSQLPVGQYTVTRNAADGTTASREARVNVGTAANVDFVSTASDGSATTLDTITVVGTGAINPIDVSSVESTTILTAEQIAKIPVARDTTSVALLAPGTVRGDAAFGNLASFGGASVAENQYFVNGFNVTNAFRNLNFGAIPFEAVAEQQIKTGGYGAEFGHSLGGVINQITKRGTNEFHAGGNIFWSPEDLNEETRDTYLATDGTLRQDNSQDTDEQLDVAIWASGALIQDRLFAYGLISYGMGDSDTWGSVVSGTNTHTDATDPTWLLKLDWNITDNHALEFTAFSDKTETEIDIYENTPGVIERGSFIGTDFLEDGGENYILKYTGYLTDTFTLSALYGYGKFARSEHLRSASGVDVVYNGDIFNPASGCPVVGDTRPAFRREITGTYVSTCNISGGTVDRADSGDTRKQFRIDAEWQLGDHLLRFGYDQDDYESLAGVSLEGGSQWTYFTDNPDGLPNTGDETDLVQQQVFSQGATLRVEQNAFYIQDSWSITDNFIAYLGLRWDNFKNINGQGQAYVNIENQFGPRLGFSWDVFGDSTFKVFGNAGRYALPLTSSVAVRGASASIFSLENFIVTDVDPVTGAPIDPISLGDFRYLNAEFGGEKAAQTIASQNLEPQYQDEYILGFQKQLTDNFSVGVRGIYRELKTAIDDNCDYAPILSEGGFEYVDGVGFVNAAGEVAVLPSGGFPYCRMFNPGEDAVFITDYLNDGNFRSVTIPGELLSPPAKRKYSALEFFFDGNWDRFFLQGSYTYAKSKGNTEGGVKSDIGQGDTNVTQDFDYLALTVNTFGYLPNDRRHTLKLFGNYDISDQWAVGANLLIQSGRPRNCLGVFDRNPDRPFDGNGDGDFSDPGDDLNYSPHPYGSSFMQCGTTPLGGADDDGVVIRPRGTSGRLPWTTNLDLNVAYRPDWAEGLQFKVDVFNVFNSQKVTSVIEQRENRTTGQLVPTYELPNSFQASRSVRFMVQYDF